MIIYDLAFILQEYLNDYVKINNPHNLGRKERLLRNLTLCNKMINCESYIVLKGFIFKNMLL